MDADAVEIRVLGCLIEKQRTTPDVYPLSLNSLRLACNQATNREPVVDYDEPTVRAALEKLSRRGWVRLATGPGSRTAKYRHLLDEALGRVPSQIALLAVLMLRGPQTPGELKSRVERLYPYASLEDVQKALEALIDAELVAQLPRRPGQSQDRFAQLLGGDEEAAERRTRKCCSDTKSARGARRPARGAGGRASAAARRAMIVADPWFDYLALPVAPLVLFLQFGTLFLPRVWQRAAGAAAGLGAIGWMTYYVLDVEVAPDEGASIGGGLMIFWLGASLLLVVATAIGEVARIVARRNGLVREDA